MTFRACWTVFLTLLAACGDAAQVGMSAKARQDSDPPARIESGHHGLRLSSGAGVTAVMRIDGYDESLVPLDGVKIGRDLSVVVAQGQDHQVRFYDAAGSRRATVGRRGTGPGEFVRIGGLGWVGDTLWVWDLSALRFSFYASDGHFLRTAAPLPDFGSPVALYGNGAVLVLGKPERHQDGSSGSQWPWLVTKTSGEVVKRLASMPYLVSSVTQKTATGGSVSAEIPFFANVRYRASQDGKRIGFVATDFRTRRFNVVVHDSGGQRVFDRHYPFDAFRIPRQAIDSVIAEKRRTRSPTFVALYERMNFPQYYAPVQQMLIGIDYTIWVRLYRPGSERTWLVLAANGEPIDTLVLPPKAWPAAASLDDVWVVEQDEFDVPSIVRYRVDRSRHSGDFERR